MVVTTLLNLFLRFMFYVTVCLFLCSVSCRGNRHPISGNRAPAVTMTCWHVSLHWPVAYGVTNHRPVQCGKWRRRVGDL